MLDLIALKNNIDNKRSLICAYLQRSSIRPHDYMIDDIASGALIRCIDSDSDDYQSAILAELRHNGHYFNHTQFLGDMLIDGTSETTLMDRLVRANERSESGLRRKKTHSHFPEEFLIQISPTQREILEYNLKGLSHKEISKITRKHYQNVVSLLHRVRTLYAQYRKSSNGNCRKKRGWPLGNPRGKQTQLHIHNIRKAKNEKRAREALYLVDNTVAIAA